MDCWEDGGSDVSRRAFICLLSRCTTAAPEAAPVLPGRREFPVSGTMKRASSGAAAKERRHGDRNHKLNTVCDRFLCVIIVNFPKNQHLFWDFCLTWRIPRIPRTWFGGCSRDASLLLGDDRTQRFYASVLSSSPGVSAGIRLNLLL